MGIKIIARAMEATLVGNLVEHSVDENGRATIGRSPECDMVLNDPSLEPRHACIEKTSRGWGVTRLGRGEVLVNGTCIAQDVCVPLMAGDHLQMGVYAIGYFVDIHGGKGGTYNSPMDSPESIQWKASLVVLNGPCHGKSVTIDDGRDVVLGRGRNCDLMLDDKRVSRSHARITNRGGVVWVEDMGSSNGVYINSTKCRGRKRLEPGDVIRVGRYRIGVSIRTKEHDGESLAMVLAMPNQTSRVDASVLGLLCLALSVAACAAAYLI